MTTVAAGTTATYTFQSAGSLAFSPDAGELARVFVNRAGVQVWGGQVTAGQTIGPFRAGDVATITAVQGEADYTFAVYVDPSLVSGAGTSTGARLNSLAASTVAPILLDDYQDHSLYTITGGTGSTVAAIAGGGRVSVTSVAPSTTALAVTRTIPYSVVPSKIGRLVASMHQTGTKAGFGMKLGSDATVTQVDSNTTPLRDQGQQYYSFHASEFATTYATTTQGTFALLIQASFGGSHPADTTVVFGKVWAGMTQKPFLGFSFDDGYVEIFTRVFPLFQSLGLVGTVYACRDKMGIDGRLSWDQARMLTAAGWSICVNSTPDDSDMSTTVATAVEGVRIGQQLLVDNGVAINGSEQIICYAGNASTAPVRQVLRAQGVSARTTNPWGVTDVFGFGDQAQYLPSYSLSSLTVEANAKARIDQAVLRGETQLFHAHQPVDGTPTGTQVSWAVFEAVVRHAASYINSGLALNANMADYVSAVRLRTVPAAV